MIQYDNNVLVCFCAPVGDNHSEMSVIKLPVAVCFCWELIFTGHVCVCAVCACMCWCVCVQVKTHISIFPMSHLPLPLRWQTSGASWVICPANWMFESLSSSGHCVPACVRFCMFVQITESYPAECVHLWYIEICGAFHSDWFSLFSP